MTEAEFLNSVAKTLEALGASAILFSVAAIIRAIFKD